MKICRTEQEFIDYVAPFAQRVCKRYGYKPSILIAQAFHENGAAVPRNFDNNGIYDLMKYNNMVGQKARLLNDTWSEYSVWPGKYFYKDTPEEYGGRMVTINDAFRIFDSVEQSFADFVLFLLYAKDSVNATSYRYGPDVVHTKDPHELIRKVGRRYATGSGYAEHVWKVVTDYKLTKYDDLTNVKPTDIIPPALKGKSDNKADNVDRIHIIDITKENTPVRWGNTGEALVFHFLGVAGADNPYLYGGGYGGQWYISRDGKIYHSVKKGGTVWAVGSGGWGLKGTKWNNDNTESVEMGCENDNGSDDIYDKKWWFHMVTQQNAIRLARYWLESRGYGVSEASVNKRILIHNTITNKPCPAPWLHCAGYKSPREKGHVNWNFEEFKRKIWQGYKGKTIADDGSLPLPSPITPSYLKQGDAGSDVKTMQKMLIACGYSCGSSGADGQFGSNTLKAVKAFQKAQKLTVDGIYGVKTKAVLEKVYKAKKATPKKETTTTTTTSNAAEVMIKAVAAVGKKAHDEGWHYDDSHATPPCSDKKISCDRIIARALWDLGYHDQPKGGITCNDIPTFLYNWKFIGTKKQSEIKPGAVVAVGHGDEIEHVFVVEKYNHKTGKCDKYDAGSNARIAKSCHFKNVDLLEWADREFIAAWNVPENLKGAKVTTKETTKKTTESKTTKNETKKTTWKAKTTATATVNDLNVRDKAGIEGKVLRTLNKGNRFEVDGKTSGNWVHVNVLGVIGWVHKKYIKYD